jgi:hypothetical protein
MWSAPKTPAKIDQHQHRSAGAGQLGKIVKAAPARGGPWLLRWGELFHMGKQDPAEPRCVGVRIDIGRRTAHPSMTMQAGQLHAGTVIAFLLCLGLQDDGDHQQFRRRHSQDGRLATAQDDGYGH